MVTQNMLRTNVRIKVSSEKNILFVTARDLIKYLQLIKYQVLFLSFAPSYELSSIQVPCIFVHYQNDT